MQNSLTLHIALATVPRKEEKGYAEKVKYNFYSNYVEGTKKYYNDFGTYYSRINNNQVSDENVLYNPLTYYIFGNYDIAFISLVDSYKFAQKLFSPKSEAGNELAPNPNSFQILTGISSCKDDARLRNFFSRRTGSAKKLNSFIGICSLKINNGILIGNGQFFYDKVVKLIQSTIEGEFNAHKSTCLKEKSKIENDYLILQSFSWFEISLILFIDDPELLSKCIAKLRGKTVSNLDNFEDLINNSLYYNEEYEMKSIEDSHVFADTHTYFGVSTDEFLTSDFMNRFLINDLNIKTHIEYEVKPGHLNDLVENLYDVKQREGLMRKIRFLTGKMDYFIPSDDNKLGNAHHLIQRLNSPDNKLYKYVKKIKTKIQFLPKEPELSVSKEQEVNVARQVFDSDKASPQERLRHVLKSLAIPSRKSELPSEDTCTTRTASFTESLETDIFTINNHLKALKVSRQIRAKIIKIFFNFNNGIQDSILFIYFIDFKIFITELIILIQQEYKDWYCKFIKNENYIDDNLRIELLEKSLMERINVFQEGYNIRMLNFYQFEDINDFDLDFNSSIPQLLTTYNTWVINIGNIFYTYPYRYAPIVQLNLKNTEANYHSINYNVYHLMSPEFVFFTVTKEILNFFRNIDDVTFKKELHRLQEKLKADLKVYPLFDNYLNEGLIDFDYLFIDAIRFYYIADLNFKLFSYWFWTFNFQNSSLYDKTGIMDEGNFKTELFRLMFLGKLYKFEVGEMDCPLPEIQHYWNRNFYKTSQKVNEFFANNEGDISSSVSVIRKAIFAIINFNILQNLVPQNENPVHLIWKTNLGIKEDPKEVDKIEKLSKDNYIKMGMYSGIDAIQNKNRSLAIYYFKRKYNDALIHGQPILYDEKLHHNPHMFINALMYSYLELIYDLNLGKVRLLRRNWATGDPLVCFIKNENVKNDDYLYNVDQTGGTFFTDPAKLNKYFSMRNGILQTLWHFSLMQKKSFISQIKKYG